MISFNRECSNKKLSEWLSACFSVLANLQTDYGRNKGLILTEGDLECLLFGRLNAASPFQEVLETKTNGWATGWVHSQVSWFKENEESGFKPDLSIFDPENIKVENIEKTEDFPNKGFFHDGLAIAIELKFFRHKPLQEKVTEDIVKIFRILKHKEANIKNGIYRNVVMSEIAFLSVIVCKTTPIFDHTRLVLSEFLKARVLPANTFCVVLSHNSFLVFPKTGVPDV